MEQVYSSDPFEQKGGYVLRSSGINMTFKPYNPKSHRIQTLQIAGKPIQPEKTYGIVAGGSQPFKKFEDRKQYQNIRAIDVIQSFLQKSGPYNSKKSANIISV